MATHATTTLVVCEAPDFTGHAKHPRDERMLPCLDCGCKHLPYGVDFPTCPACGAVHGECPFCGDATTEDGAGCAACKAEGKF